MDAKRWADSVPEMHICRVCLSPICIHPHIHTTLNFYIAMFRQAIKRTTQQKRAFSDHAPPKYEGLEASVRNVLPEDWQIVAACLSSYVGIYALVKLTSGGAAEEKAEVVTDGASSESEIPSMFSSKFEAWTKTNNMKEWEGSIGEWEKGMNDAGYAKTYEASLK